MLIAQLALSLSLGLSHLEDDAVVCAVASYTFSTGDLMKVAGAYNGRPEDLPDHVYLIQAEKVEILMDRRDPLISSLLLRSEMWSWIKDAKNLKQEGLRIGDAPPALKEILVSGFQNMGFESEGLADKRIQLKIHEDFKLALNGEEKKGGLMFAGSPPDIQPMKSKDDRRNNPPAGPNWAFLMDQVPLEFRIRFVDAPKTRTDLASRIKEVQAVVSEEVLELEKESVASQRLGAQSLYKALAPDLPPPWSVPGDLKQLDQKRWKECLNALGFLDRGDYDRWIESSIESYDIGISFGLKSSESGGNAYLMPLWKKERSQN